MDSPQTVNKDLRHIRVFTNWYKKQNYIAQAPDFKGQFLAVDAADPDWVPKKDIKAILKALTDPALVLTKRSEEWWGVFIRMAVFTRNGEPFHKACECGPHTASFYHASNRHPPACDASCKASSC